MHILTFYLTFFLAYPLTFCLASILTYFLAHMTFFLTFYLAFFGILFGIYSDIQFCDAIWHYILGFYLAFIMTFSLTWALPDLNRGSAHWDLELAVEEGGRRWTGEQIYLAGQKKTQRTLGFPFTKAQIGPKPNILRRDLCLLGLLHHHLGARKSQPGTYGLAFGRGGTLHRDAANLGWGWELGKTT